MKGNIISRRPDLLTMTVIIIKDSRGISLIVGDVEFIDTLDQNYDSSNFDEQVNDVLNE